MAKIAPGFALGGGLHGSAGSATFVRTPYGVSLRARTQPRNPRTPAQVASRTRMARASFAWKQMTIEQAMAWRDYAVSLSLPAAATRVSAQNVFIRLATKFLQVSPNGEIPLMPPSSPFGGDAISISASAVQGGVRFASSGGNGGGVATELLLQPLASVHRRAYEKEYRTKAFHVFPSVSLYDVSVPGGVYACAVRFVRIATGECTELLPVGLVSV